MENIASPLVDKVNLIFGGIVFFLDHIFGKHWILFAAFLLLNIIDYITGIIKSRINKNVNSNRGSIGIMKKIGYWLMICVAFMMGTIFIEIGETIGVNLQVTTLIGWLVLATFIINEIRSILENFVECGYNVPKFLTKSLEVANKVIEGNSEE